MHVIAYTRMFVKNAKFCPKLKIIVHRIVMSSESDEDAIIFHRQNINDNELDSSSSLSSSSSDDDQNDRLLQKLKRTSYSKRRITRASSSTKKSKFVQVQEFNLGRNFDPQLGNSIDRIESVKNEINNPSTVTTVKDQKLDALRSHLKPNNVSSQYIDLVVKETISGRYFDWHFINNDTKFEDVSIDDELIQDSHNCAIKDAIHRKHPKLEDLLKSMGADLNLLNEDKPLTNKRNYDSLSQMIPIDSMMRSIETYQDDKKFIKYLLCFVLDRKIWESQECDYNWCSRMLESVDDDEQIIDTYLSLADRKDYFMHYRLSRCISRLRSPLIQRIIEPFTIEREFTRLIEHKNYESLLYFTLFVYGSHEMPFGPSTKTQYFKDTVEDMCHEGTNAVELSLLRGLLNLFLKIRIS